MLTFSLKSALLPLVLAFGVAHAADTKGNFAIEGGGSQPCARFLDAREKRNSDYAIYAGWVEGYVTAANQHSRETYDYTPWQTTELLMAALAKHCEKTPQQSFFVTVNRMLGSLKGGRMKAMSEIVAIESGSSKMLAYRSVVQDVQRQLAARRLFAGPADGKPTPALLDAIKRFQVQSRLPANGLPDQMTLIALFRPGK